MPLNPQSVASHGTCPPIPCSFAVFTLRLTFESIKELESALAIAVTFLEEEIICRFNVPRFILTDNGGEWMVKFDMMCKKYGIAH